MRISGLGLSPSSIVDTDCGTNPCTWWDEVWVRDGCLSFLRCADPTNPLVVGMDQGFSAGVGAEAGDLIGGAISNAAGGVGTGIKNNLNLTGAAVIGGVALLAILLLKGR